MKKQLIKRLSIILAFAIVLFIGTTAAVRTYAADASVQAGEAAGEAADENAGEEKSTDGKAFAAAIVVGVAAAAGAIGMGLAVSKSAEGMSRQPEAAGKINSAMMLGLVFIETAIIYALIVAILIIFVL